MGERGQSAEAKRILSRFVGHAKDLFVVSWLLEQFLSQSTGAIAAVGYIIEHFRQYCAIVLDPDQDVEALARESLMNFIGSNWLGAVCVDCPTVARVLDFINEMLNLLLPDDRPWQIQALVLLLTRSFLENLFFYVDQCVLEGIIEDRILPGLLHQHPEVQDAAFHLLQFVVRSSVDIAPKLPPIVEILKKMLFDKEMLSRRIAGAKGIGAVIMGTLLFDSVPDFVVDGFQALTDAQEMDSTVEQVATQFFADFWAVHDNNLAPEIADVLAPFHARMRPSYFS
jgi:hypothetical protein